MIVALGDLHDSIRTGLTRALRYGIRGASDAAIVQVGDLCWHPDRPPPALPAPLQVYFVDGNHDHLPSLLCHADPTEVAPGWIYCPRGSVLTLAGKRVGFLGGARSIDRETRIRGETWWESEELSVAEARRLQGQTLDLLVTHTPPSSVIEAMGHEKPDQSSILVQRTWEVLGHPRLVCGHMHQRFRKGTVTVLGEMDLEIFWE
jgi:hypothetical protein